MSISPFHAGPASQENERRRARLVVLLAMMGIGASLLAYSLSPTVRHAVGHAAHSVKHAVSRVFDHDRAAPKAKHPPHPRPAHPRPAHPSASERSRVHAAVPASRGTHAPA